MPIIPEPCYTGIVANSRQIVDYGTRTDLQPVYVGVGNYPSANDPSSPNWLIHKYFYDTLGREIDVQAMNGFAWTDRATLPWKNPGT